MRLARSLTGFIRSAHRPRFPVTSRQIADRMAAAAPAAEAPSDPKLEARYQLIRSVGEECVTERELRDLVAKKPDFRLYDGFEPSGRMHIAQGIFKAMNVNKCTQAGGQFVFWVADWFALMNDKMGGDLAKIRTVGQYLIEVWKATGMDMSRVEFVWCADAINKNAKAYWIQALDIARRFTVARLTKCCAIMGRKEGSLTAAQILYPLMQCTDIFFLRADVCQLGVDQRKVNMLARDYCDAAGRKLKPVILSHHMLYGLKKGQEKMSKSDPDSAVFMEDTPEDVRRKIGQAYCPSQAETPAAGDGAAAGDDAMHLVVDTLKNPCLDYVEHIVFAGPHATFEAAGTVYPDYVAVRAAFLGGSLTEADLKAGLVAAINALLDPVRAHFQNDPVARELLETIKEWKRSGVSDATAPAPVVMTPSAPVCVVRCPLPRDPAAFFSLHSLLLVVQQLRAVPEGTAATLLLGDWNAFVVNCLGAEETAIRAAFTLFVAVLRVTQPALMAKVRVVWQSEVILANPNDYWVTVINVGRATPLKRVRTVFGGEGQSEETQKVHDVVMPLMHVADIVLLNATDTLVAPEDEGLHHLAQEFATIVARGVTGRVVDAPLPLLKKDGAPSDPECHVSILDNDMEVNSKLKKKAFCEPQNVAFCPPLALVTHFLLPLTGAFHLDRKEADGGPKDFQEAGNITAMFASGALHPGDLKTSVAKALNDFLGPVREHLKGDTEAKKAVAEVDKCLKRLAKGKAK